MTTEPTRHIAISFLTGLLPTVLAGGMITAAVIFVLSNVGVDRGHEDVPEDAPTQSSIAAQSVPAPVPAAQALDASHAVQAATSPGSALPLEQRLLKEEVEAYRQLSALAKVRRDRVRQLGKELEQLAAQVQQEVERWPGSALLTSDDGRLLAASEDHVARFASLFDPVDDGGSARVEALRSRVRTLLVPLEDAAGMAFSQEDEAALRAELTIERRVAEELLERYRNLNGPLYAMLVQARQASVEPSQFTLEQALDAHRANHHARVTAELAVAIDELREKAVQKLKQKQREKFEAEQKLKLAEEEREVVAVEARVQKTLVLTEEERRQAELDRLATEHESIFSALLGDKQSYYGALSHHELPQPWSFSRLPLNQPQLFAKAAEFTGMNAARVRELIALFRRVAPVYIERGLLLP